MTSEERRFWKDAYLAAIPSALDGDWSNGLRGDKYVSYSNVPDRMLVAKSVADKALADLRERTGE